MVQKLSHFMFEFNLRCLQLGLFILTFFELDVLGISRKHFTKPAWFFFLFPLEEQVFCQLRNNKFRTKPEAKETKY